MDYREATKICEDRADRVKGTPGAWFEAYADMARKLHALGHVDDRVAAKLLRVVEPALAVAA